MAAKKKAASNGKAEKASLEVKTETISNAQETSKPWQFKPGNTASRGRPKGSRNKLAEEFINDFYNDWLEHGQSVIALVRSEKPDVYFKGAVAILPKQVDMTVGRFADLTEDTLDARVNDLAKELGQALAILKPGRTDTVQ